MAVADYEELNGAVRSRFHNLVATAETPDLPTEYDNHKIKHPTDSTWARVNVHSASSQHVQLGSSHTFRTAGTMTAQLFAPMNTGTQVLDNLADKVVSNFRNITAAGVTYMTPSVRHVGRTREWWQVNVVCPFFADTIV